MQLQTILFICRHNSVRSQVAALLARKISHGNITAISAGPEPTPVPAHVQSWAEQLGVSEKLQSQGLDQLAQQEFDLIITLCDKSHQALPQLANDKAHICWDFHHADTADALKHLEIELADRIRLLLLTKGVI